MHQLHYLMEIIIVSQVILQYYNTERYAQYSLWYTHYCGNSL